MSRPPSAEDEGGGVGTGRQTGQNPASSKIKFDPRQQFVFLNNLSAAAVAASMVSECCQLL